MVYILSYVPRHGHNKPWIKFAFGYTQPGAGCTANVKFKNQYSAITDVESVIFLKISYMAFTYEYYTAY